jgi:1,4-alpha-glucan branching enzyme
MIQTTYLKTKKACKVKFTYKDDKAEKVELLGLNNDWNTPIVLAKKKDGSFSAEVSLPIGTKQEFKYLVNGTEWVNEPEAEESENEFGSTNSLLNL